MYLVIYTIKPENMCFDKSFKGFKVTIWCIIVSDRKTNPALTILSCRKEVNCEKEGGLELEQLSKDLVDDKKVGCHLLCNLNK